MSDEVGFENLNTGGLNDLSKRIACNHACCSIAVDVIIDVIKNADNCIK